MSSIWSRHVLVKPALLFLVLAGSAVALAATPSETPFHSANTIAMEKMMAAMAIDPSGDVDKDFIAMMVPHHQAAIDMAQTFLRYGHNEQLKRLAQEIIVTQQQEIAVMRLIADPLCLAPPSPPGGAAAPSMPNSMKMASGKM